MIQVRKSRYRDLETSHSRERLVPDPKSFLVGYSMIMRLTIGTVLEIAPALNSVVEELHGNTLQTSSSRIRAGHRKDKSMSPLMRG